MDSNGVLQSNPTLWNCFTTTFCLCLGWWDRWGTKRGTCCWSWCIRQTRLNDSSFGATSQGVGHVDGLGFLQNFLFLPHTWGRSGCGQLTLQDGYRQQTVFIFLKALLESAEGKRKMSLNPRMNKSEAIVWMHINRDRNLSIETAAK